MRNLVREGAGVTVFDLTADTRRLQLLLTDEELDEVTFVQGDITDLDAFGKALDAHDVTNVIHLAGLQVPFCKADPPLGARVNVVGTANVFEAVKHRKDRIPRVTYASSIAVFGAPEDYEPGKALVDDDRPIPHTHYGVYKRANEGTAHVYWVDDGIPSVGLRPYVVYGVARDQGLSSTPTTAMLAAAAEHPYHISYGGRTVLQYAEDTANAFIQSARSDYEGAGAFNLSGLSAHMQEVKEAIITARPDAKELITFEDFQLPFPMEVDGSGLEEAVGAIHHKALADAIGETIEMFAGLIRDGKIDPKQYIAERS